MEREEQCWSEGPPSSIQNKGEAVKTINNKEARQALLHELRKATCLQVSLWDTCYDVIGETLEIDDPQPRVIQVSPDYAGKQLTDADLDLILSGFEELNVAGPIGREKMQGMGNLTAAVRLKLSKAFQNAIDMQNELRTVASKLAQTLDCGLEYVVQGILEIACMTDTGKEVDETHLQFFLGEPMPEGYTRIADPIKPQTLPMRKQVISVKEIEEGLEFLEAQGLVRRNGEFRRASSGFLQPVYALTPLGIRLRESGEFEKYLSVRPDDPVC